MPLQEMAALLMALSVKEADGAAACCLQAWGCRLGLVRLKLSTTEQHCKRLPGNRDV